LIDDLNALLSQMTPEELEELLALGTLDERGGLLQQQMAQAEALRQPSGRQHSTGLGAALGGIGDLTKFIGGTRQMDDLRAKQEALMGQKDAGRGLYANAIRRRPAEATPDIIPAAPFSLM
jgi:hypothetical protein